MPLVLSLKAGEDFYLDDDQFVVEEVSSAVEFTVRDAVSGKCYRVTDTRATEIRPNVFVSAGEKPQALVARLTIEAPRSVLVVRGDKKRNPPDNIRARQGET
jgi:hypothetical protein